MTKTSVGFIGLGRMGLSMARNLAAAGYALRVYDIDPRALERAAAFSGVTTAAAPRDVAARVSVLFTVLPNDEIVRATYQGRDGVLAGAKAGLVTCDCSTVSAEVSRAVYAAAKPLGVHHMDTPMLGSSPQAESGEIFFMIGGDADRVQTIQPMLDVMGRLTMYVGPCGTGNQIKLLHNALGAVNAVAVAESLALCVQSGVDPRTYIEVVRQGGGMAFSTYFDRRAQRVVEGNYAPTFTLDLMQKDVALAARLTGDGLANFPILREALETFTDAKSRGWGTEDFSAVTHVIEGRLGRTLSHPGA
jgi:3-hydroxyisobutyrate dehydrogenase-like beta-hydroxyacid dehydrogenase